MCNVIKLYYNIYILYIKSATPRLNIITSCRVSQPVPGSSVWVLHEKYPFPPLLMKSPKTYSGQRVEKCWEPSSWATMGSMVDSNVDSTVDSTLDSTVDSTVDSTNALGRGIWIYLAMKTKHIPSRKQVWTRVKSQKLLISFFEPCVGLKYLYHPVPGSPARSCSQRIWSYRMPRWFSCSFTAQDPGQ